MKTHGLFYIETNADGAELWECHECSRKIILSGHIATPINEGDDQTIHRYIESSKEDNAFARWSREFFKDI